MLFRPTSVGPRVARAIVPALLAASSLFASAARAEQFIVTDVSYTHSGETTKESHYRVVPLPGSPSNWKAPVDYATGSAHVLLEVKTKPTDTATRFQICFEGANSYACTAQSVDYKKPGTFEWTTKFSDFWYPESDPNKRIDWSKGVKQVALILKDTSNGKPQGDPKYVPTDLRVQVAIITSGTSFAPPVEGPRDAGASDIAPARPLPDAGPSAADASSGAPQPPRDAATGTGSKKDAATPTASKDASASSIGDAAEADDPEDDDAVPSDTGKPEKQQDSGCNLGTSSLSDGLPLLGGLLMMALARKRRKVVRVPRNGRSSAPPRR